MEETETAREFLLKDLSDNHCDEVCIEELASIWYDDSPRHPIDFWIYQFLKHGCCALDDPMLDYASPVGPDFGDYFDFDLGDYLLHKGFCTNEYHLVEDLRYAVQNFCMMAPRLSFIRQEGHTCLNDISILRTYPDGFLVDHPLSIPLRGYYFLMRMI